jgi:small subunit ribosomal protein S20
MVVGGQRHCIWQSPAAIVPGLAVGHRWLAVHCFEEPLGYDIGSECLIQHRGSCSCPMANIKSQIKRNRQNEVRAARNKAAKSELKTRIKAVSNAAGTGEGAEEFYRAAQKKIDVAASKGLLHPNTAARRKSRLAKKLG